MVSTVTLAEAQAIRSEILTRSRAGNELDADGQTLFAEDGVFYLIQLEPEHDPGRVKLGFTTDLDGRLRKHRCSAPFGQCLKAWPCLRRWERAAIDPITAGLEQLHTEVFRAGSMEQVVSSADRFFAVMPMVAVQASSVDDFVDG